MRLIDADVLKDGKFHSIEDWTPVERASWQLGWNDAIDAIINSAPTVDPYKHGHWTEIDRGLLWQCSECEHYSVSGGDYCEWCGAKMDEVEEDG